MNSVPVYPEILVERINIACSNTGMSVAEICRLSGFSRSVITELGRTKSTISSGNLAEFCKVTGADANWLLGLNEEEERHGKE